MNQIIIPIIIPIVIVVYAVYISLWRKTSVSTDDNNKTEISIQGVGEATIKLVDISQKGYEIYFRGIVKDKFRNRIDFSGTCRLKKDDNQTIENGSFDIDLPEEKNIKLDSVLFSYGRDNAENDIKKIVESNFRKPVQ